MISEQDRRALLAVVLCFAVYVVWMALFPPPPVVAEGGPEAGEVVGPEGLDPAGTETITGPGVPTPSSELPVPVASTGPEEAVRPHAQPLTKEGLIGEVASANGSIRGLTLSDYNAAPVTTPIYAWLLGKVLGERSASLGGVEVDGGWTAYTGGGEPLELLSQEGSLLLVGTGALDDDGAGTVDGDGLYEVTRDGSAIVATRTRGDGVRIVKRYAPGEQPFTLDITVDVTNGSGAAITKPWFGVADRMSGDAGRFTNAPRPLVYVDEDIEHIYDLEDLEGAELEVFDDGQVGWFGVGDRYFMSVLIPLEAPADAGLVVDQLPGGRAGSFMLTPGSVQPGETVTTEFLAYLGPKRLDVLEEIGHSLDEAVEFGWFGFFSRILLFFLKMCHSLVGNWGVAILMLTLLVKAAFFPLTQKAYTSSKRMQAIQPKLAEIKEQYKDNRELQTQKTMALFQENGVNPMGGCLPTLIQMPVWFALYNVMLYSVELFDSSFLYLQDLTAADPYGVLPTLYAIVMVLQQRMMPMGSMDPAQQRIIKMMPLIFSFFMFSFPSGLVLYFSVNMMLTVVQQQLINRKFPDAKKSEAAAS